MVYLTISDELDECLSALAAKVGMSKDEYARQALEEFVASQENYFLALAAMKRLEKGEKKTILFEEI